VETEAPGENLPKSVSQSVSQYVLVSSPLCGRFTRHCFLFKGLDLEFVVLSLWGALSDERPGLSFVSHILVICLCVHLLFIFLSFKHLPYTYTIYSPCEAGKNTSTISLLVVRGDGKGTKLVSGETVPADLRKG
jgi:hypothetical protein